MPRLNNSLISRKIKLIESDLSKLQEFKAVSLKQYQQSLEIRLQVERLIERIIGRVIDINYHLLKTEFNIMPNDYYRSFTLLGKKGIIDRQFADKLTQSAGLRNALAHEYDQIDDAQIHSSIQLCLQQIPRYLQQILDRTGR